MRLVLFYDAGQVRDFGQPFGLKEDLTTQVYPTPPLLGSPSSDAAEIATFVMSLRSSLQVA